MSKYRCCVLPSFLVALSVANSASGQQDPIQQNPITFEPLRNIPRDIFSEQKAIWTSPAHMNRRQFLTRALPLVAGSVALITVDKRISHGLPSSSTEINWSRNLSNIVGYSLVGAATAGSLLAGTVGNKPGWRSTGWSATEAFADAIIVSQVLKMGFGRQRPDESAGRGAFWKDGNSFPSGHSMMTWAVATAVARNKRCPKWLAFTAYGAAAAVSVSRVSAQRHFTGDVFAGGIIGALIGNYVAGRHE
ncbi:MAG: phosphatase PAP2 family protein [Bryobacterales bacterium]|nr:phosphatase PAP2 family protein [Bryobacterales bacterium]